MTSLRQRMLEDMQVRRLSPFTQRTYVETVARFARYFDRSPERLGPEQIRAYQVYLATERGLATSSLLVAVAALRFLYSTAVSVSMPRKHRNQPTGSRYGSVSATATNCASSSNSRASRWSIASR